MSLVGEWRELGIRSSRRLGASGIRGSKYGVRGPAAQAAALLGPASRTARNRPTAFLVGAGRERAEPGIVRLLRRLDDASIGGTLTLLGSEQAVVRASEPEVTPLAESWDAALAACRRTGAISSASSSSSRPTTSSPRPCFVSR